ncbi:MAG: hypothetical protein FWG16_08480, partial [Micrococcales bacterium]|nr:hypothetical protein [Micrococcales bacterium]
MKILNKYVAQSTVAVLGLAAGSLLALPATAAMAAGSPPQIVHVTANGTNTFAIDSDGDVWLWGMDNYYGQMGTGGAMDQEVPTPELLTTFPTPVGESIIQIAAGTGHTLALTDNGRIMAWGQNTSGQLGLGDTTNRSTPQLVAPFSGTDKVVQIFASALVSMALTETGVLWVWGANQDGFQNPRLLGLPTDQPTPTVMSLPGAIGDPVVGVDVATGHVLVLTASGAVYSWGRQMPGMGPMTCSLDPSACLPAQILAGGAPDKIIQVAGGVMGSWGLTAGGDIINLHTVPPVSAGFTWPGLPIGEQITSLSCAANGALSANF